MRRLALALSIAVVAGCGPSASLDRLSSDLSGKDPVLQVWTHAKRIESGADAKVLVDWNHNLGTGILKPEETRSDNVNVVRVEQWTIGGSSYDKVNEMEVRVMYQGDVLKHRTFTTPTDFANAFGNGPK